MQFVAASKLKRAQDATLAARPYSEKLDEVLADLAAVLGGDDHPLLGRPRGRQAPDRADHDRPAAGRAAQHEHRPVRRARDHRPPGRPRGRHRRAQGPRRDAPGRRPARGPLRDLRRPADLRRRPAARPPRHRRLPGRRRTAGSTSSTAASSRPSSSARRSLHAPADPAVATTPRASPATSSSSSRAPSAVLEQLLPRYVATRLYQAVLEAKASEESSRMVAMKNATENAEELIEDLTLSYNKVRQANITREMIEIASGAQRPLTLKDAGGRPPMATAAPTATGRVIQITGPVVDIEFPAGQLPAIYNAVEIERDGPEPLVCEVQQHLGNNWVRAVAMTTTDGLARGVDVRRHRRPDHRPGRRGRPSAASSTSSATRSTARARSTRRRPRCRSTATPPAVRPAVDRGRGLRDRPQGHRPDLPVQEGRQDRHLRRRRRRQDGHHPGADPQRRPGARRRTPCSPASASAAARATTSSTR